jgi:hypothetical protein
LVLKMKMKKNFELPVKRSRALLGSNPARDSRLRGHHASGQVVNPGALPLSFL